MAGYITQGRHGTLKSSLKHFTAYVGIIGVEGMSRKMRLSDLDKKCLYGYQKYRQSVGNYPAPKKKEGIKKEIKESCKLQGEDLVLMQIGEYYTVIEEDAEYFYKNYKFKYTDTREDFYVAGFHVSLIKKWKAELIENGEKDFCIVEEVFKERGKNILREVTFSSSNKKSLGLTFVGGVKK